jgi:hypothetical protein
LELLKTLKDGSERKKIKTQDIDFLIEVFVSGNSYVPNLSDKENMGGAGIDEEMKAFVLGNVLGVGGHANNAAAAHAHAQAQAGTPNGVSSILTDEGTSDFSRTADRQNDNRRNSMSVGQKGANRVSQLQSNIDSEEFRSSDIKSADTFKRTTSKSMKQPAPSQQYRYQSHQELLRPLEPSALDIRSINDYLDLWYHSWNFDMFEFSEMAGGHPLYFTGMWLMEQNELLISLKIDKEKFKAWLMVCIDYPI